MPPPLGRLFEELKRRIAFRVVAAYAALVFVVLQVADLVVEPVGLPASTMQLLLAVGILGFSLAVIVPKKLR